MITPTIRVKFRAVSNEHGIGFAVAHLSKPRKAGQPQVLTLPANNQSWVSPNRK